MTPEQITLVQQSFSKVAPISEQAAVMFYDRLFEVAPSVRAMFPADMTEQRKKLMGDARRRRRTACRNLESDSSGGVVRSPSVTSPTAPRPSTIPSSARLAVDPGKGAWRSLDARSRRRPGPPPTASLSGYMISEAYGAQPQAAE